MADTTALTAGVYQRPLPAAAWPGPPVPQSADLTAAMAVVRRAWPATPLVESVALSRRFGRRVFLKLESLTPIRSFKFRGAVVAAAERGSSIRMFTASTGNHGQGIAYAASLYGSQATVCAPQNALPSKVAAMRDLGAEVVLVGTNLSEAQAAAMTMADQSKGVYLEDGEDPALMAGAATVVAEVLTQLPDAATLVVPVGGGNLMAGSLLAAHQAGTEATVVGVQSTAAPGATASWLAGEIQVRSCTTFAGGLATEFPGTLSLAVMLQWLTTMALVDEPALYRAAATAFRECGLIVEGAAAATIAALQEHRDRIPDGPTVLVITGSWLSADELAKALAT